MHTTPGWLCGDSNAPPLPFTPFTPSLEDPLDCTILCQMWNPGKSNRTSTRPCVPTVTKRRSTWLIGLRRAIESLTQAFQTPKPPASASGGAAAAHPYGLQRENQYVGGLCRCFRIGVWSAHYRCTPTSDKVTYPPPFGETIRIAQYCIYVVECSIV